MDAINLDAFKDAEVPTDIYPTKENPYAGLVAALVGDNWDTETQRSKISKTAVLPYKTDADVKAVNEVIRLAQLAGKTVKVTDAEGNEVSGVTVKKTLKADGKGKATLTLWAVKRITRTAKDSKAEGDAEGAEESE